MIDSNTLIRTEKKMAIYFLLIFLFLSHSCFADIQGELTNLKGKLNDLLYGLQPSAPSYQPSYQPPSYKQPQPTPTGRLMTPTPLKDSIIDMYTVVKKTPISRLNHIPKIYPLMTKIYLEWLALFDGLDAFDSALNDFSNFIKSGKLKGTITEPQKFVTLADALDAFFNEERIKKLKKSIIDLIKTYQANPSQVDSESKNLIISFFKRISTIYNTLAEKTSEIYDDLAKFSKTLPVDIIWTGEEIAQGKTRTMQHWFNGYINMPMTYKAMAYNPSKGITESHYLNAGYIRNAIQAFEGHTVTLPGIQQPAPQPTAQPQPTPQPMPSPVQPVTQPAPQPTPTQAPSAPKYPLRDLAEKYKYLATIPDIENFNVSIAVGSYLYPFNLRIMNNLSLFERTLEKFKNYLISQQGETINEPDIFVELVKEFREFFDTKHIASAKMALEELLKIPSNSLSAIDKKTVHTYLTDFSDLLNQIYEIVDQFAQDNQRLLHSVKWEGEEYSVMTPGIRAAYFWFNNGILDPLHTHAAARNPLSRPGGGPLNAEYLFDAIRHFKP